MVSRILSGTKEAPGGIPGDSILKEERKWWGKYLRCGGSVLRRRLRCHPLWRRIDGSAADPRGAVSLSSLETSGALGGADNIRDLLPAILLGGNWSRMIMKLYEKGW
jgi:hypothetical protein